MSVPSKIGTRVRRWAALAVVGGAATAAVVVASVASSTAAGGLGQPPPDWNENAGAWPAHNYELANTRATTQTPINSQTVSKLKVKWRFNFKHPGLFGAFSLTPISLNGTVYLQDLNSNVYALDRQTGKLNWQHIFNKPSVGPNGVSYGYGRLYGATETNVADGAKLFGNPKVNSGGGLWYPPGRRQPGTRLHLRRQPGAALRDAQVPQRVQPSRRQPVHRRDRRPRRPDR